MKLSFCFVVMQMLLLVFSNKLVKHEFECYRKSIFVTFAFNTMDGIENDEAAPFMKENHKISYNVSTCVPTYANSYCRNKYTFWVSAPCYQRYRDNEALVKCFLAFVYEIGEHPLHMYLTFGVRIRFFQNEERKGKTVTKMLPFTPFLVCSPNINHLRRSKN